MLGVIQIINRVEKIASEQGYELIQISHNIQGSVDVELDRHCDDETEAQIRAINGVSINDIYYQDA